jgi:hypothetical protein
MQLAGGEAIGLTTKLAEELNDEEGINTNLSVFLGDGLPDKVVEFPTWHKICLCVQNGYEVKALLINEGVTVVWFALGPLTARYARTYHCYTRQVSFGKNPRIFRSFEKLLLLYFWKRKEGRKRLIKFIMFSIRVINNFIILNISHRYVTQKYFNKKENHLSHLKGMVLPINIHTDTNKSIVQLLFFHFLCFLSFLSFSSTSFFLAIIANLFSFFCLFHLITFSFLFEIFMAAAVGAKRV